MTEPLVLATLVIIPLLYSLGGMFWKPLRRYGVPLAIIILSLLNGSLGVSQTLSALALCVALHLGYGEGSNWFMKAVYAIAISLPSIIIKFSPWCLVIPIVFLGTFYLSNNPKTQNLFSWRICEYLVGLSIAITYSQIL